EEIPLREWSDAGCVHRRIQSCSLILRQRDNAWILGEVHSDRNRKNHSYSAVIFASRTTFPHFCVSRSMYCAKSLRLPGAGSSPCFASSAFTRGSFKTFVSSRFQKSSTSAGVLAGATNAYQLVASKPG